MPSACSIRLRPVGPWRYGPGDGGAGRIDHLYRSDRLYSAVTLAMRQLGFLDQWLEATARSPKPAVVFTSLFPYQGDLAFAPPPSTLWPPPASLVKSNSPVFLSKIRWNAARFVPVSAIESLLLGQPLQADQWMPDAESGCLLRRDRPSTSPFRTVTRTRVAVDRLTHATGPVETAACVEFEPGAGLWTVARYADSEAWSTWNNRVKAAFRLLADTGFGGRRTSGWGRTAAPEFEDGAWPNLIMPKLARAARNASGDSSLFWLLSLYSSSGSDSIDWSGGDYRVAVRGGWVENAAGSGARKKRVRMIAEGSVLSAASEPVGAAVDVAPDGFAHPVYRAGFALALRLPVFETATDFSPVEQPTTEEAAEPPPCETPAEVVSTETEPSAIAPAGPSSITLGDDTVAQKPPLLEPEPPSQPAEAAANPPKAETTPQDESLTAREAPATPETPAAPDPFATPEPPATHNTPNPEEEPAGEV